MWTANKRMPLGVPRVGEVLKGGRVKNKTEKENPQHKRTNHSQTPMDSFTSYIIRQAYEKVKGKGDRLAKADQLLKWEAFRPIIKDLYRNDTEQGGRPNTDEVVMVKLLVIQQWIGRSLER
jgi:hypothetical protein